MYIADLFKRVLAGIIDLILVMFVSFVAIYFFNSAYPFSSNFYDTANIQSLYKTRGFLLAITIDFIYTTYSMNSQMNSTYGMHLLNLKITTEDGQKPSYGSLCLRYLVSLLSSIFVKIGYLFALFNEKNQTIHDLVAKTIVIDEEKEIDGLFGKNDLAQKEVSVKKHQIYAQQQNKKSDSNEDEIFWEMALTEYESDKRKAGLYAKLYATNNGDDKKIKIAYIKIRADQLINENYVKTDYQKSEEDKKLNAKQAIFLKKYTVRNVRGIVCLLFANGQAAIQIDSSKYRLYEDDRSLEQSIRYYLSNNMYLNKGFIEIIEIDNEKKIIHCPRCSKKTRVPRFKNLEITCPSCKFEWNEKT